MNRILWTKKTENKIEFTIGSEIEYEGWDSNRTN